MCAWYCEEFDMLLSTASRWSSRLRVSMGRSGVALSMMIPWMLSAGLPAWGDTEEAVKPPNVMIIVLDTARADRMSCYGYLRPTTPRLDAIAESSQIFDRAYATSSWTIPSHASMFTGQYAAGHGATQENWRLDPDAVTLAEILAEAGYVTFGVHGNPIIAVGSGFEQGFEHYEGTWDPRYADREGNKTLDAVLARLSALPDDKPFFGFVNIIEPHSPYDSAGPYRNRFTSDPSQTIIRNGWAPYYAGNRVPTPLEQRHLSELYDGALKYADHLTGGIIDKLVEMGVWDDTVFIVTSDHGDNFGENGHFDHVFSLYEGTLHIPLIVRYPQVWPGGRESAPVQLTDIFPTVLEVSGIGTDKYPHQGVSLLPGYPEADRAVFAEYYYPRQALEVYANPELRNSEALKPYRRQLRSVYQGGFKYIWASKGYHELYWLERDPREKVNLIHEPEHARQAEALRAELDALVARFSVEREGRGAHRMRDLDAASVEALRALGYLE